LIKLIEAIKELQTDLLETGERKSKKLRAAQRLGIQALKREIECRKDLPGAEWLLLPGEKRE